MSQITSRVYEDDKDFQVMINLLKKIRTEEFINDSPTKVDIEENLANEEVRANTRLWFDGDQLIGWAYVDDSQNLRWELDEKYTKAMGGEITTWGETCIRKILVEGKASTLDTNCREDNVERLAFIRQHGFRQTETITVTLKRNLSEPIPEFKFPQGFSIRSVNGAVEAEAIASTHRAAFGTDYMTTENRLIIMNTSGYDPSLDLVAIAPDGSIAAYCTCSVNEQGKEGSTDPVATHPNYQRMGLAWALLVHGLRMLKERGMKTVTLGTSGDNIAMQKTAESVGFVLEHRFLWFEKVVTYQDLFISIN
jgi:ribosomal protein S18 acetylase RimI-like enzyme